MKYFIYTINCLLVVIIPVLFVMTPNYHPEVNSIRTTVEVKQLQSGEFIDHVFNYDLMHKDETVSLDHTKSEIIPLSYEKEEIIEKETNKAESVIETHPAFNILESHIGKMSGYGPDCKGCSGYLSSGRYVGDGDIYYNDSTYGRIRIVAGDKKFKFGTIVRIKNSRVGDFNAIVLDRGGSIGFGKTFLFDLLYPSEQEALKDEISFGVTFEILRYGY